MYGIDLFSGAGGMSLGAEAAGVRVKVAVESDPHAAATFCLNHPQTLVHALPIQQVRKVELVAPAGVQRVVFGGPPCQGFSTSNQRTRNSKNADNWLFKDYLRIVKSLMPDWIIFENVTGISVTEGGRFLSAVVKGFRLLGYKESVFILNAADYGVPQKRSRLFVVASLHGEKYVVPGPLASRVTVREAIGDLPALSNGSMIDCQPYAAATPSSYATELRGDLRTSTNHLVTRNSPLIVRRFTKVPQGGNWASIPLRQMKNYADTTRCHTGIYRRLCDDEPAVVIGNFRKNMLIHPTQHRGLSVREAARLQSFPDSFVFAGSIGFQQQQVGNAVPPLLAKVVFAALPNIKGAACVV
jgi:DNA (cytosine-5)-methyltransferase 1